MPDPFEALRLPAPPTEPDPAFAARLQARIQRALDLPRGVTVSDLSLDPTDAEPIHHGDVGYVSLWVPDADRAAHFFGAVLGWTYGPSTGPAGARRVEGVRPDHGLQGGEPRSTLFLCFAVDDLPSALERVRAAGGEAGKPHHEPYGDIADCVDTLGTRFALYQPPASAVDPRPLANGGVHGDISYLTMEVTRSEEARAFYGSALGWGFHPGRIEDGWGLDDVAPMAGMSGGHPQCTVVPMYRVDDVHAAVACVRRQGGTATDPEEQPYGWISECVDDQGTRFYLGQH
jgi:uncharacterized protein